MNDTTYDVTAFEAAQLLVCAAAGVFIDHPCTHSLERLRKAVQQLDEVTVREQS